MRAVWGPRISHPDQLLACNQTTLLTEKQDLLNRWTEHLSKLLNEAPEISLFILERSALGIKISCGGSHLVP
jgi:hypothetical protein